MERFVVKAWAVMGTTERLKAVAEFCAAVTLCLVVFALLFGA